MPKLKLAVLKNVAIGPRMSMQTKDIFGFMRPKNLPVRLRHHRHGRIADRTYGDLNDFEALPDLQPGQAYFYGAPLIRHIGHLFGEFSQRFWALDQIPEEAVVLFPIYYKGFEPHPMFDQFLDFIGVKNYLFVDRPVCVPKLYVAEQAKKLGASFNPDSLQWLERLAQKHQLAGPSTGKIAMTRSHMPMRPLIGEAVLEKHIEQEGYQLYLPEKHDLVHQLRTLYNAEQIIVADGSACHLFDLLPPLKAKVFFYGRRRKSDIARFSIAPKVSDIHIFGTVSHYPITYQTNNQKLYQNNILTVDLHMLTSALVKSGFISNALPPMSDEEYDAHLSQQIEDRFSDPKLRTHLRAMKHLRPKPESDIKAALPSKLTRERKKLIKKFRNIGAYLRLY